MEVLAEFGKVGAGIDQPLCEIARMAGGKADALDTVHVMNLMQEVRQRVLPSPLRCDPREVSSIGIDVLSQQRDLLETLGGKPFHFQADGLWKP